MGTVINLQDTSTWPREIHAFLETNADFYRKWFAEPPNHWGERLAPSYDHLYQMLDTLLSSFSIESYHCTRFTDTEIREVNETGLRPLSFDLLKDRLRNLPLDDSTRNKLLQKNDVANPARLGRIWFCLFPPIQQAHGVSRFFRNWGGEALYNDHEADLDTIRVLRQIGHPCVVKCSIPVCMMKNRFFISDILRSHFTHDTDPILQEDCCTAPIRSSSFERVYHYPSQAFLEIAGWNGK